MSASKTHHPLKLLSITALSFLALMAATASHARLACEEIVSARECTDGDSRVMEVKPGVSAAIPAPTLTGYSQPCWNWSRKFLCIETDPTYACASGTPFDTVKKDCNLSAALVKSTLSINGIQYITDADYTYQCAYGAYTANQELPPNMECVNLKENYTYHDWILAGASDAVPSPTLPMDTDLALEEQKHVKYVCYAAPVTTCSETCYKQVVNPVTGQYEQVEAACDAPVDQCSVSKTSCNGTLANTSFADYGDGFVVDYSGLGPDGRCVDSTTVESCRSGSVPRCLSLDNCQLTETRPADIQSNGTAMSEEQIYMCSNETTTCTEYATVSNCLTLSAWGWDRHNTSNSVGKGLAEANQALAKLEAIEKGMKQDDPYIFSGKDMRCHYAVGNFLNTAIMIVAAVALTAVSAGALGPAAAGFVQAGPMASAVSAAASAAGVTLTATQAVAIGGAISAGMTFIQDAPNSQAFGSNCCKEQVIEGSDKWYKLGSCTADEVRLSIAKVKGLSYFLGDYCSKKGGFPIKQCVQRTKSYCVFDDMLALTVNEQGRRQLEDLADADAVSTQRSEPFALQMYGPEPVGPVTEYIGLNTGHWEKITTLNNSQVWYWQYPAYCKAPAKQQEAYTLYNQYLNSVADLKGVQPDELSMEDASKILMGMLGTVEFQECPTQTGMMAFMTCGLENDNCRVDALPAGPDLSFSDMSSGLATEEDLNWEIQQGRAMYSLSDYGITATVDDNPDFARVSISLNQFMSAQGSCHEDGDCRYQFSVTDKSADSLGVRKRVSSKTTFPLYTVTPSSSWPAIDYMARDGSMVPGAYESDPNRGLGTPETTSKHRFIFHPHYLDVANARISGNALHSAFLLEHASRQGAWDKPQDDYTPLVVPVNLPEGSDGWWPHLGVDQDDQFYLSGSCDPNTRWCTYRMEVDLKVARHPWGTAQNPRCWGFSIDQMAALDFDRMDLSKWINSLDLDSTVAGMSEEAAKAMADQTLATAQTFYSAFKAGASVPNLATNTRALVTNTEVLPYLSGADYSAYQLEIGIPSNWPMYYDDQPNENPITSATVDWGDGSAPESLWLLANGRGLVAAHDYGDRAPDAYKVTVTVETTHNGTQTLSTSVLITPDKGKEVPKQDLDFAADNGNAESPSHYTPSEALNGVNIAEDYIQSLSPGTVEQFQGQGDAITRPTSGLGSSEADTGEGE